MTLEETIAVYCAAWDESDRLKRIGLLERSITADALYVDPTVKVIGISALSDHIEKVSARYPGSRLVLTSVVDMHHGLARFGWRKILADGTELPESIDIVELADDGKLARILGFFGPLQRRSDPRSKP